MKKLVAPKRAVALVMALALILIAVSFPHNSSTIAAAQDFEPTGVLSELAIEDGTGGLCAIGQVESLIGQPGLGWVNKLTPATYPATLRSLTIGFNRAGPIGREVKPDDLYRIVVYLDPEMNGPENQQQPAATFIGRVRGNEQVMTFNLVTPITINEGSFVIGAIDEFGIANLPALYLTPGGSNPPGSQSFVTLDGGATWRTVADAISQDSACGAGSFLIRATVETNPVEVPTITRIKDPLAVEPWGVAASNTEVFVTNLVSNNVTVIRRSDNSFQNVSLGIEGVPFPGPFGVAVVPESNSAFVTIFGSSTIPTKEFPFDYSTIGDGLVVRLVRQANGAYSQAAAITVGKGPMFPSVVRRTGAPRLYVPCAGANRVDVVDTSTNQKVAEIPVGNQPSSCTTSLTGAKVYVTNFGDGTISVINTQTNQVVKTIPAPLIVFPQSSAPSVQPVPAQARNPWMGAVSQRNGNLYVTYWGSTAGDREPNGAVAEFDTCTDTFLRAIIDDTTRGTPAGSAGASGIPAPTGPLAPDAETGTTTEAGGGGGGPFGITSCSLALNASGVPTSGQPPLSEPTIFFTNDALGLVSAIDARIDQVVAAPAFSDPMCPKPRGIACTTQTVNNQVRHFVYVACGQPDSSVLVISAPALTRENIPDYRPIEFAAKDTAVRVRSASTGFLLATRVELIEVATGACLTFNRNPKLKKMARVLVQKGGFTDGRAQSSVNDVIFRLIYPDGSVRLIFRSP